QLQPFDGAASEGPRADDAQGASGRPASSSVGAEPVADLADVARLAEPDADRAEDPARLRVGDGESRLADAPEVGECVFRPVRLRNLVEPARDLGVTVDALD